VTERADGGTAIGLRLKALNMWHFDTLYHAHRNPRSLKLASWRIQLFDLQLVKN